MSESDHSSEDRNLPASERKLSKAREDGQIARSRDMASALSLGAGLVALSGLSTTLVDSCRLLLSNALRFDPKLIADSAMEPILFDWAISLGAQALWLTLPVLLICAVGAIAGQIALGGLALTTKPMMPDFSRINPAKGLERIFSMHSGLEFGKLLIVVIALVAVSIGYVVNYADQLPGFGQMDRHAAMNESMSWLRAGAYAILAVLVLAAVIDGPIQWLRHHNQMKMTLQEVKQEAKDSDGDPHVKARIKGRQRELARSRMMAAIPKASVIITNPTHYAVALQYDEASMGAPRVVAKGVDLLAAKIREAGELAGVPILEAPPLARALYAHTRIGMEVRPELYSAVAQVLAYIYQLRMHMKGEFTGADPIAKPDMFPVPAELDPGTTAALDELDQTDEPIAPIEPPINKERD